MLSRKYSKWKKINLPQDFRETLLSNIYKGQRALLECLKYLHAFDSNTHEKIDIY